ncbi:MAG: type II toxin-antitoxin system mRNA interferase toxin, RelE/StbE family [Patescibacteria group bacterium]
MLVDLHKNFKKQYKKLPTKLQYKFNEKLKLFIADSFSPELNNHNLHGKYFGCRSINITGDLRAIYEVRENGIRFLNIDNHSNLY